MSGWCVFFMLGGLECLFGDIDREGLEGFERENGLEGLVCGEGELIMFMVGFR